jgi:3-isopropylmalate/(R)-2-methylmalate dehydratase small subunit
MTPGPFARHEGLAAPLWRPDVDTDVIVPSREITGPERDGYGEKLFAPWRYLEGRRENPDFVLNREPFRRATVLVAGPNFGCGSSREMAAWAVRQFGFRVVIAPSFGAIFRANLLRNGVLPATLPPGVAEALADRAQAGDLVIVADLRDMAIAAPGGERHAFALGERERLRLLEGLDEIGLTLREAGAMAAWRERDREARPWAWREGDGAPPPAT